MTQPAPATEPATHDLLIRGVPAGALDDVYSGLHSLDRELHDRARQAGLDPDRAAGLRAAADALHSAHTVLW